MEQGQNVRVCVSLGMHYYLTYLREEIMFSPVSVCFITRYALFSHLCPFVWLSVDSMKTKRLQAKLITLGPGEFLRVEWVGKITQIPVCTSTVYDSRACVFRVGF